MKRDHVRGVQNTNGELKEEPEYEMDEKGEKKRVEKNTHKKK